MALQLLLLLLVVSLLLLLSMVWIIQQPAPGLRLHQKRHLGRPLRGPCCCKACSICIYSPSLAYCCCYGLWRWWWWLQVCGV
jgi:hypothetical protein